MSDLNTKNPIEFFKSFGKLVAATNMKLGDLSLGATDRNVITSTFIVEYKRLTGRSFADEDDNTIDVNAVRVAQENAEKESAVSATHKKAKWLKEMGSDAQINLAKRAFFVFTSHVSSVFSQARGEMSQTPSRVEHTTKIISQRIKKSWLSGKRVGKQAMLDTVGPMMQAFFYHATKPQILIPAMAALIGSGDDEEEEIAQDVYDFLSNPLNMETDSKLLQQFSRLGGLFYLGEEAENI